MLSRKKVEEQLRKASTLADQARRTYARAEDIRRECDQIIGNLWRELLGRVNQSAGLEAIDGVDLAEAGKAPLQPIPPPGREA